MVSVGAAVRQVKPAWSHRAALSAEQFPHGWTVFRASPSFVGHRRVIYYDTRDSLVTPTDGMSVMAYAELGIKM